MLTLKEIENYNKKIVKRNSTIKITIYKIVTPG